LTLPALGVADAPVLSSAALQSFSLCFRIPPVADTQTRIVLADVRPVSSDGSVTAEQCGYLVLVRSDAVYLALRGQTDYTDLTITDWLVASAKVDQGLLSNSEWHSLFISVNPGTLAFNISLDNNEATGLLDQANAMAIVANMATCTLPSPLIWQWKVQLGVGPMMPGLSPIPALAQLGQVTASPDPIRSPKLTCVFGTVTVPLGYAGLFSAQFDKTRSYNGDIAEVILYNTFMDPMIVNQFHLRRIEAIEWHLASRWGFSQMMAPVVSPAVKWHRNGDAVTLANPVTNGGYQGDRLKQSFMTYPPVQGTASLIGQSVTLAPVPAGKTSAWIRSELKDAPDCMWYNSKGIDGIKTVLE